MKTFNRILKKKRRLIIGLMSGTSADGVDSALVEVRGSGLRTRIRLLAFRTYPYPRGFRSFLLRNSDVSTARLDDVARLHFLIGEFFAEAAREIVQRGGKRLSEIDLIGSHGQTIHHLPENQVLFNRSIRATLQIGNPSVIAKRTGIVTVGDFRSGDVATGGTGAPLVPYFDYLMFRSPAKNLALLNIGGIANITVIPANGSLQSVTASDTGPGNMVIDGLMQKYFRVPFDEQGECASRGTLIPSLLRWLENHPFLKERPPKSTGRECFGKEFIQQILNRSRQERKRDVITTVTEFTALSIYQHYIRYVARKRPLDELIVSGGGVHNTYLMDALKRYFERVLVRSTDQSSVPPDAKEAICFAVLANETIAGNCSNVPGATGAHSPTILGTICLP